MPKSTNVPSKPPLYSSQHRQRPYPPSARATRPVSCLPSTPNQGQQSHTTSASNQQYQPLPQTYYPGNQPLFQNHHRNQPRPPPFPRINTALPRPLHSINHFPPPPNFTFRCPDQRYPQYTLSSRELRQSIPDFIAELVAQDKAEEQRLVTEKKEKEGEENGRGREQGDRGRVVDGRYDDGGASGHGCDGGGGGRGGRSEGGRGRGRGLKNASKGAKVSKGQSGRKKSKTSIYSGGGLDIPGTRVFQTVRQPKSPNSLLQPKKEDDGVGDKEPRVTPEIEANEGDDNDKALVDSPFKDHKELQSKVSEEAAPTRDSRPQLTNNGWPLKPTSSNPSPTSTTSSTQSITEGKNPKPPRPWLPPIKESEESIANVELTPEQQDAKHWKDFEPIIELNARTHWTLPLHRQPTPKPAWHAGCPDGYEPTLSAGFPLRKAYSLCLPAAHDPNQELGRYGHWCLHEEDEWDWCVMGKCEGCLVCRPYGS